ncbi:heme-degrading domain-containing protein [Uliginosibacterium sp. H3]|uniref:UPF0303 protein VVD49_09140 n=1 Tax=Uliginosibacterium silvisoli TaxID=3114758 RepID=A0ABU6K4A0_9RHOO|nr:heme-degrading domain-containing protein [Uliginosibacterium sp. H3]
MSLDSDLNQIAIQEERLQFDAFNATTALDIGLRLRALIESRGKKAAIDIQLAGHPLFFYAMLGTTPDNGEWIRRKRNVVMRFHKSSYAFSLGVQKNGHSLMERFGAGPDQLVLAGGGFPIRLRDSGVVGSITVSGLPQRDDHGVIVEVLADVLGQNIAELALGPEER